MMATTEPGSLRDEAADVLAWNVEQLQRLAPKLSYVEACTLAAEGSDWHEVKRLLDAGCAPELALRIARGLGA